jgi:flavin-dependent dehydrogenase
MLRQPNHVRQAFGPGWALVGDAGYYRDAVTAYGISDAFRDAELLAVAVDQALAAAAEETTALALYQQQRDEAIREIFEITCRLAAYPTVPTFIELQKQLGAAIDKEAAALAARPIPGERLLATA